eukprot:9048016-Pyramimonas_sp.AAC.1
MILAEASSTATPPRCAARPLRWGPSWTSRHLALHGRDAQAGSVTALPVRPGPVRVQPRGSRGGGD